MLHQAELKKCILYKHNYTPPKQKLMHKQQRTLTLCSSEQKKEDHQNLPYGHGGLPINIKSGGA